MYRAIIVDDEIKICQLIQCLGQWEKLGIEVMEICQDGETALQCIKEKQPDIVLTDIRMPIYDGLEIIRQTRAMDLKTAFIVISGYKQFEYARQALQYGVVDFLVKPINQEDLNAALQKAVNGIIDQENVLNVNEILYSKEKNEKVALLNELTTGVSLDEIPAQTLESKERLFKKDIYQAVIIKTNRVELNKSNSKFSEDILSSLERIISIEEAIEVAKDDGIYLLLNYEKSEYARLKALLFDIEKKVMTNQDIYGQFEVTMGVGLPVSHIWEMKQSIDTAKISWQQRILRSDREYIEYEKTDINLENSVFLTEKEWHDFNASLESCNKEEIKALIEIMESRVQRVRDINVTGLYDQIEKIVTSVEKFVQEVVVPSKESIFSVMEPFRCADTISDLFLQVKKYNNQSIQAYYENKISMKNQPIIKAEEYISSHYMEDLSLEEMAAIVELSPTYFSKLFKTVQGLNYIEYLTKIRIEKSKTLLKSTNMSIKAIASEVGYLDEKYFRKLFKKTVGIKPSEYRKLH